MHRDGLRGRDVWAGLLFIGLGAFAIVHSYDYPIGTLTQMGPGYFPTILGGMMMLCGATIALGAVLFRTTERISRPNLRGVLAIAGSVVGFAVLLDRIGLPATVFCSSMIACAARRDFLRPSSFLLSAIIAALCTVVFIYLLNIPIRLSPPWIQGY